MTIRYLKYADLDLIKWDQAIDQALNGLPYAYSWYLDIVCDQWGALVSGDYTYVMPLPWNAKWVGIKQIYQPFFTQQLGILSDREITVSVVEAFIESIPPQFRYVSTCLNEHNPVDSLDDQHFSRRTNMILDISIKYEEIRAKYRPSLSKRIKKVKASSLHKNVITSDVLSALYREQLNHKVGLPNHAFSIVSKLMERSITLSKGLIYSAHSDNDELLAAVFMLKSHGRLINLFGASTAIGRDLGGMHWLLDQVIKECSGTQLIFDFEGSELPSIAHFFEGYRPQHVSYFHYIRDNMPAWVRAIKHIARQ